MNIPTHIAIIMDGNGRWAEERRLPRSDGHRYGAMSIDRIVEACHDRNIKFLTIYAFSEENWNRPNDEVDSLMLLLRHYLISKKEKMLEKGVRFRTIGDISKLSPDVRETIYDVQDATKSCAYMTLIVALSYGGRQEIMRAIESLVAKGAKNISVQDFENELDTKGIPDPDLLIRTSGEYRISNFLLWQLAYAELYFTETLWPDFNEKELDLAIESYSKRERRYGLTSSQLR